MLWRIGTIGFSYPDWVGPFYPHRTRPADFLATYAHTFDTVELDTTFHAAPAPERVRHWAGQVPRDFLFCPKVPRAITHDQPLAAGREFHGFLAAIRQFGATLGPILVQFPPSFTSREFGRLETFLRQLPEDLRFALEFRHNSWENDRTFDLLARHRVAWVASDYGVDPFPIHATTDFLYVRFIGIHQQFADHEYERTDMTQRLIWWQFHAERLAASTTYAFFNNDYAGHAPATAARLKALVGQPAPQLENLLF